MFFIFFTAFKFFKVLPYILTIFKKIYAWFTYKMLSNCLNILLDQKPSWENLTQGWNIMFLLWGCSGLALDQNLPQSMSLSDTDMKVPCWALGAEMPFSCGIGHWADWTALEQRVQGTQEGHRGYQLCCVGFWSWFLTDSSWSLCDLTSIFRVFE